MKPQTLYRGNDNKVAKPTKADHVYNFVQKLKKKAAADAAKKAPVA